MILNGGTVADRWSSPINEPRVSSRLTGDSVLSADEVAKTISDVKVAAAAEQERLARPMPDMVNWRRRPLTAVVFLALAAAVWGAQLLVWRAPTPRITDRDRDARLRFTIALQVARVEDFRENASRLPNSLGEVSEVFQGMTYAQLDSTHYRLTGTDSNLVLSYRSDSSIQSFVGGSLLSIRERKKQ